MLEIISFKGLELRFFHSGATTAGAFDLFEMTVDPQARVPIPHYHDSWEETVYGLSGIITFRLAGEDIAVKPGETVFIKRGVVHGFRNDSAEPARCLWLLTPGVLGPSYFREMRDLIAAGPPDPPKMKEIMQRYGLVPAPLG